MSSLRVSQKPTLGLLLSNPESEQFPYSSQQKITFPKINTNLKKNQFTKYRSAFISAKSCNIYLETQFNANPSHSFVRKQNDSSTPEKHHQSGKKMKSELNTKNWKLNNKQDKCYSMRSQQKLDQSRNRSQSDTEQNIQRKENILNYPQLSHPETKKKEKFTLLTQIRENSIFPVSHAEKSQQHNLTERKSEDINKSIEHSNKIISLIEKNYRKGFFNPSRQEAVLDKLEQKLGLFAYLKRNFVTKKQTLTPEKMVEYFKSPSNKKLQAKINFKTRSFLKQKLHNDYHSYKEVEKLREDLSEQAIKQQISEKKVEYRDEYNKKYNVPYLSFLSLPKNLKVKVLENLTHQNKKINKK